MIKSLRKKFMIICMLSVLIVLSLLVASVNISNYHFINRNSDQMLDYIAAHDGILYDKANDIYITPETKYETRFFSILFDENKQIISANMQNIASITKEEAEEYAYKALNGMKERGFVKDYRYLVTQKEKNTRVILIDCSKSFFIARRFINISVVISLISLVIVFAIAWFLSTRMMKPIVDSYNKQKKFITDAGHELKTPLTIISANAELMELEYGDDECLEAIKKQVVRMTQMTKNLTSLSQIDETNFKKEMYEFSFTIAALEAIDSLKKVALRNNLSFNYNIEEDIVYNGNERLIRELIYIITDNAIKYSLSYVDIQIYQKKNKIFIEMTNDTNGIEKGNLNHYYNRFYRTDEARASSVEGSGIGLSIAYEIVNKHKGEMKLSSDDGITFKVKIIL